MDVNSPEQQSLRRCDACRDYDKEGEMVVPLSKGTLHLCEKCRHNAFSSLKVREENGTL